jgi:hypothetical protein
MQQLAGTCTWQPVCCTAFFCLFFGAGRGASEGMSASEMQLLAGITFLREILFACCRLAACCSLLQVLACIMSSLTREMQLPAGMLWLVARLTLCLRFSVAALLPALLKQVLACIGEQFEEGDEVCGVTVNIRAGKDRIELWTKTAANEALQMSIGKQLKQLLDIPDSNKIGFVVFVSTLLLLLHCNTFCYSCAQQCY